jgi:hypothetical protein
VDAKTYTLGQVQRASLLTLLVELAQCSVDRSAGNLNEPHFKQGV